MSAKVKFWVAGIVLAIIGIVTARLVAQSIETVWLQLILYFTGVTLAIAGLGVILFGVRSKR